MTSSEDTATEVLGTEQCPYVPPRKKQKLHDEAPDLVHWLDARYGEVQRILQLASRGSCWEVLGLIPGTSSSELRSKYRKVASQVHPDKCDHPKAGEVFQLLSRAVQECDHEQQTGGRGPEGHDEGQGDTGPSWWECWDELGTSVAPPATTEPSEEDHEPELAHMTLADLEGEVRRRQRAVLAPVTKEERDMTLVMRQKRLRVARAVLSERLREPSGVNPCGDRLAGGFLRTDSYQ